MLRKRQRAAWPGPVAPGVATIDGILGDHDIDAVLICTPTDMHADLIEAAMLAGKAVFCEKPVDLDAARIRTCLRTVEAAGKPLMIASTAGSTRILPPCSSASGAGEIGAIEIVSVISRDPGPPPWIMSSGRAGCSGI